MRSFALQLTMWFALCLGAHAQRTNVVFFLVDDLGQRDVGCYGSTFYETPAIDQLAKEGMLFNNAYSTCHVCSPSRASIQTGKYPGRTDLTDWLRGRPARAYEKLQGAQKLQAIPDSEQTLAETLKANGYRTAFFGKAHLGKPPAEWGFDESTYGWYRSYHYPFNVRNGNGPDGKEGDYLTDRFTDLAVDFIERHKDQPFYLHMAHFAVHDPIHGRKDLVEKYQKKLAAMPKSEGPPFILEGNPDGPPVTAGELKAFEANQGMAQAQDKRLWWVKQKQDNVEFAGMLEATDESLARIRAKLKELGLEKNTIIIFTADNGGMSASNQYLENNKNRKVLNSRFASSNLPLRGAKGWNYEGGIRVPLIVHWPGKTRPGSTSNSLVTGTDYYPTLLEMIGLPAMPEQHVDGRSFVPALEGRANDRGAIYWHFPHYSNHGYQSPNGAIRLGQYKLIEYFENGNVQLFDLENDIGEKNDLSKKNPEITAKLRTMLHDWRKAVDAKMPTVKTAEDGRAQQKPKATAGKNLPGDVAKFAPGWSVRDWGGPNMKPGLRSDWGGRKNVLVTHPKSRTVPCVLSRKIDVPAGKTTVLSFDVNDHVNGDWKLVVRVNGTQKISQDIDGTKWKTFRVDLSEHAGKTAAIELENRATGWSHEAGFWHSLRIESK